MDFVSLVPYPTVSRAAQGNLTNAARAKRLMKKYTEDADSIVQLMTVGTVVLTTHTHAVTAIVAKFSSMESAKPAESTAVQFAVMGILTNAALARLVISLPKMILVLKDVW